MKTGCLKFNKMQIKVICSIPKRPIVIRLQIPKSQLLASTRPPSASWYTYSNRAWTESRRARTTSVASSCSRSNKCIKTRCYLNYSPRVKGSRMLRSTQTKSRHKSRKRKSVETIARMQSRVKRLRLAVKSLKLRHKHKRIRWRLWKLKLSHWPKKRR